MKKNLLTFLTACFIFTITCVEVYAQVTPDAAGIIYVAQGKPGDQSGNSWVNAIPDLGMALNTALTLNTATAGTVKQIWVAEGTYVPTVKIADTEPDGDPTGSRDQAFRLVQGVKLYGGFAGNETDVDQRDDVHVTILSGDLNANDLNHNTVLNNPDDDSAAWYNQSWAQDNAYHVVVVAGYMSNTLMDGFTIIGGNGNYDDISGRGVTVNGQNVYRDSGGAIAAVGTSGITFKKLHVTRNYSGRGGAGELGNGAMHIDNCLFDYNVAKQDGGAFTSNAALELTNSTFRYNNSRGHNNTVDGSGGAVFFSSNTANVSNCLFENNMAARRGAGLFFYFMSDSSPVSVSNCTFRENSTGSVGGGGGGGMAFSNGTDYTVSNCKFLSNSSTSGAGLYTSSANTKIKNCIFSNNRGSSSVGGAAFRIIGGQTEIYNTLITGNYCTVPFGGSMSTENATLTLVNNTITNNKTTDGVGGITTNGSQLTLYNNIFWDNSSWDSKSDINDNSSGVSSTVTARNNIFQEYVDADVAHHNSTGIDPQFIDPVNNNYGLQESSPAVNTGDDQLYTNTNGKLLSSEDADGNKRWQNAHIDLGALETSFSSAHAVAGILYVNSTANSGGDGSDWEHAFQNLGTALVEADALNKDSDITNNVEKIYVAEGTYYPSYPTHDSGVQTSFSFVMPKDVALLGGFPSSGNPDISERDWRSFPTILSGDLGTIGDLSDNSNHVLIIAGDAGEIAIDGFTIEKGNAQGTPSLSTVNGTTIINSNGGGLYYTGNSTVKLHHLNIRENQASDGGGFHLTGNQVQGDHLYFAQNTATANGGGLYTSSGNMLFNACTFSGNQAGGAGGAWSENGAEISMVNSVFNQNEAFSSGGAAIFQGSNGNHQYIVNSTFFGNQITDENSFFLGGAVCALTTETTIENSIFYNNAVNGDQSANMADIWYMEAFFGKPTLTNLLAQTDFSADDASNHVITTDPFKDSSDPDGSDDIFGTSDDGLQLTASSNEALGKADATVFEPEETPDLSAITTDIMDSIRVYMGRLDLGAYEYLPPVPTLTDFDDITKVFGDADFTLEAPASPSDGSFTFTSSNPTVVTISGSTATIIGTGTATITATQAGTADYYTASTSLTITINKADPTLSDFDDITKTFGDGDFNLTAPTSNSNGAFTYTSSDENVATISGNTVTITGAGTAEITATQVATANYKAGEIKLDLSVYKAMPALSNFTDITKTFGDGDFTLTAPTSNSSGTFTYTSSDENIATVSGNTVTITGAGTADITATQVATANYKAGEIKLDLSVDKATPSLSGFVDITKTFGDGDFTLTAPTSNSSGTFTYTSSDENIAIISGNTVTIIGAGTAEITATQTATANYNSGEIKLDLSVDKATPSLSGFADITKTFGDADFALTAPTSNSNGTFNYTSSDENVATVSENTVTIIGVGTAEITATQASTANYKAGEIKLDLTVDKATPSLSGFADITKTFGDGDFTLTAPTSNSSGTFTYTSSDENVATISGNTVTITGAGIAEITATQTATANYKAGEIKLNLTVEQTLPVSLTFFTAKAEGQSALLNWTTTTESKNNKFIIYRRGDDGAFTQIGEKVGVGNSSISNSYSFYDKHPLSGNNYYRLAQVDIDGKETILEERVLSFRLSALSLKVYPNPTADKINVAFETGRFNTLQITDLNGRVLQQWEIHKVESNKTLSLANYASGTYIVRLMGNGEVQAVKVLKEF